MIGVAANDQFDISDTIPFSDGPAIDLEGALKNAYSRREDLKVGESQLRASQLTRSAAGAERLAPLAASGDYGVDGTNPNQSHGTFSATATLSIPIWRGGRAGGDVQQADAAYAQRKAEADNLHARIEGDVRSAFLDIQAAANQVAVAQDNLTVSQENLDLVRQKLQVGVSDNVEVIQAQQCIARAQPDLITSILVHNVAKLTLARAIGNQLDTLADYLTLP